MNTLASGLIWGGVQVSLLMLAGGLVYAIARRFGPAAGSIVALATLVMAIGLSVLALAPWPTWWRLPVGGARSIRHAVVADVRNSASPARANPIKSSAKVSSIQPESIEHAGNQVDAATWARTFWTTFWDGLGNRPVAKTQPVSRWPTVAVWLLLGGMSLGLARLLLGLMAVSRCRQRTLPIADSALNDLLNATRARLGCRRAIELRESAEVVSPATVGWRRPLVLLPTDRRTWSERELTVVLAHEVAHVVRGDFMGALVSQFTVALHFYNPLVHWLARQLRVEQELAADAWGAALAGGRTAYLTTLAGMALRQDDRTTIWAARPFLPARGTLLRRIEMLRDHKQPKTFAFSTPKQILLWTTAIAIGLLIAGLRGPDGSTPKLVAAPPESPNSSSPAPTHRVEHPKIVATPSGGSFVVDADGNPTITVSDDPETISPLSLDYVPENAEFVVAARVNQLATSPALRMLQAGLHQQVSDFEKKTGFSISDIEQLTYVGSVFPAGGLRRTIVRAGKPIDWSKFAATLVSNPVAVESPLTALAGKKYHKGEPTQSTHSYGPTGAPNCYIVPDDRTIIFGPESEMNWVLADLVKPQAKPAWAALWEQAGSGATEEMFDIAKLRKAIEPELHKGNAELLPYLSVAGPVWSDSQRIVIGTDLSDKKLGLLVMDQCASAAAAEQVEQTAKALLTLAGNGLAAAEKIDPEGMSNDGAMKKVFASAAEELVKQAKVSHDGDTVAIRSEANGATFLALSSVMLPAIAKSREAAQRSQSMNNLKQLALAMHMYNTNHGHLPPAVVMGPDGKTPHSWRVELLPYLDRADLYGEYHMDQPWDSPANKKVLEAIPAVFHGTEGNGPATNASYFVLTGNTMFASGRGVKLTDITSGLSNTIMIVAAVRDIPWTKPEDIEYDRSKPIPELGLGGKFFGAAFADGHVEMMAKDMNEQVLRACISSSAASTTVTTPNDERLQHSPPSP